MLKSMVDNNKYKRYIFFVVLVILAMITKINTFNTIGGIQINIGQLFILLILFLYGFKYSISLSLLINLILYFYIGEGAYVFISSLQIIFLYLVKRANKNRNIVIIDFIFWSIVFLFVYLYIKIVGGLSDGDFVIVSFFECAINSIAIMMITDLLISYVSFKFAGIINKNYYSEVPFNIVIFHIVLAVIAIPFIANLLIANKTTYNNIVTENLKSASEVSNTIFESISDLSQNDKNKILLLDTIQLGIIDRQIKGLTNDSNLKVTITNNDYMILTSNDNNKNRAEYYNWRDNGYEATIGSNYYQVIEDRVRNLPYRVRWGKGNLIYEKSLGNPKIKIIITSSLKYNEEIIIKDYISQSRLMIFVGLSIGLMVVFINKTMFATIKELSVITSNIPLKLNNIDNMPWPKSGVKELKSLSDNFRVMGYKLKEMFLNITNLNNKLEEQANELSKSQIILHQIAYYDKLTSLPNRASFQEYLGNILEDKNNIDNKIGVMFMDMDHFKQINDTLGHEQGDKLLELVGERLKSIEGKKSKVFRLGGDEFVIVVTNEALDYIYSTANDVLNLFVKPFNLKGVNYKITASLGISVYPDHSENIDEIIKNADMAMYKSKEEGGGYPQMFNKEIRDNFINKIELEKGIKEALENNEFSIVYQPQINTNTYKMESMEALIRWNRKGGNVVSPEAFINVAEESNLIVDIDNYVLKEVCSQIKKWQISGEEVVPIAVNISPRHFSEGNILLNIDTALNESGVSGENLIIEITEGVVIREYNRVISVLNELKKIGVKVAIDDFGRGYSSLTQLIKLPITEVKLDREFITNIFTDSKKEAVVELIINLSHKLNLIVVAEGVEEKKEYELLKSLKCDLIQGHYFSKALNKDEILNFKCRNGEL